MKIKILPLIIFFLYPAIAQSNDVEFNVELLSAKERKNIDLSKFNSNTYLTPGRYDLDILLNNKRQIKLEDPITVVADTNGETYPCVTYDMVKNFGLTEQANAKLAWKGPCLIAESLPGSTISPKMSKSVLIVNIPQSYLGYIADNWEPSALWSDGVNGAFIDYNMTGNTLRSRNGGANSYSLMGNGMTGFNIESWRFRADWQANINHETGSNLPINKTFDWSRLYAYKAIRNLQAKVSIGESFLTSDFFSSIKYLGANLITDMSMVPPNLRGFSPQIEGVAETNAIVTVYQNTNIVYQTQVPPGPFKIDELSDTLSGNLLVKIEEQNGAVREFTVAADYAPFITRPGSVRYRVASGKALKSQSHETVGDGFLTGELSWGAFNSTSLLGGIFVTKDYSSSTVGIGQNMHQLGATSINILNSKAVIYHRNYNGNALQAKYTKRFESTNGNLNLSSLRYLSKDYMDLNSFIYHDDGSYNSSDYFYSKDSKGVDRVSYSQYIDSLSLTASLSYYRNYFYNRESTSNYQLNMSKFINSLPLKNISLNLSLYQNEFNDKKNNGMSVNVSVPLNNGATTSYSLTRDYNNKYYNRVGYYDTIDRNTSYNLSAGATSDNVDVGGYINHTGDVMTVTANASMNKNQYTAVSLNARGGLMMTGNSLIAHSAAMVGGTRMLVDADGEKNIPIVSMGKTYTTNRFGQAVLPDVNSYYKNTARVNINNLPDNVEVIDSVLDYSLTEGSIGYKKIKTLTGYRVMAVIKMSNGTSPPLGADVYNYKRQNIGMVGDSGMTYIKGANPKEKLIIKWGSGSCETILPDVINPSSINNLLLTCGEK